MGLLLTTEHWTGAVNALWHRRPTAIEDMSFDAVEAVIESAGGALRAVTADREFAHDLERLGALAAAGEDPPPSSSKRFADFFEAFSHSEMTLLLGTGMELESARNILAEVEKLAEKGATLAFDPAAFGRSLQAAVSRAFAVASLRGGVAAETPSEHQARARALWRALEGGALAGIGGALAGGAGVFGGAVSPVMTGGPVAASISIGAALVEDAVKSVR